MLPRLLLPLPASDLSTGAAKIGCPRLRECCRQGQEDVVGNSRNKIHATWSPSPTDLNHYPALESLLHLPGSLGFQQPLQLPGPEGLDASLLVLPPLLLGRLEPVDVDRDEVDDGELDEAGERREEAGNEPSAYDVRKILGFASTLLSRNLTF